MDGFRGGAVGWAPDPLVSGARALCGVRRGRDCACRRQRNSAFNERHAAGGEPGYVSLSAKYLQSVLKDVRAYDGFEISGLRWVTTIKGWSWLACVRFHDRGHTRIYAIFIQDGAVSDARYAVETDSCEAQTYTQFDLISGELGRPTAPMQPPLY